MGQMGMSLCHLVSVQGSERVTVTHRREHRVVLLSLDTSVGVSVGIAGVVRVSSPYMCWVPSPGNSTHLQRQRGTSRSGERI
ncbi:hypothetical protein E2C01_000137 [Portunus trituberculatus]|uniref:Uncharacterized protein n=1 Tax=Portunus trituberculatus TaxID=210409 RepID=A0A5B7CIV7_PORTR|nr:hypothetical protein [Portunus trituberculatus]